MSHVGIGANMHSPNKKCLGCKYWKPAYKDMFLGWTCDGKCSAGYCKKEAIKRGGQRKW